MTDTIGVILVLAFLIFVFGSMMAEYSRRDHWLHEHCRVIGEMSSSVGFGMTFTGKPGTVFTPGKTGYQCDDGKQYWE